MILTMTWTTVDLGERSKFGPGGTAVDEFAGKLVAGKTLNKQVERCAPPATQRRVFETREMCEE